MTMARLTHLDSRGQAKMVDVGDKPPMRREAVAEGFVTMAAATGKAIAGNSIRKGEVLAVARVAGIMAAKRCGELIPLCHPLGIDAITVDFELPLASSKQVKLRIAATATITAKTGVEMEALTAVSVAALTIYDMCKAIDKKMVISGVRLVSKTKQPV